MKQKFPKDDNERAVWAQVYAAADRSDPFAAARIRTHMKNGVASDIITERGDAIFAGYSAEAIRVEHSFQMDGETRTFYLPEYVNRVRP